MIALILRSTALVMLAWLAASLSRRFGGSAASRHVIWLLAIFGLLALPLLHALLPPLALPFWQTAEVAAAGPADAQTTDVLDMLVPVYVLIAALLGLRLLIGQRLLGRQWRSAQPDAPLAEQVRCHAESLGIRRAVRLRLLGGSVMPMTWGHWQPRVLLPLEARHWPEARRRPILLHELAHIARFDSLWRMAAAIACALYWFHPAVWLAFRALRNEQEHACDDHVLASGVAVQPYGRALLDAAGSLTVARPLRAIVPAMAGRSEIERRLIALTDGRVRGPSSRAFLALACLAAATVTLFLATVMPGTSIAQPSFPPSASARPSIVGAPRVRIASSTPRSVATPSHMLPSPAAGASMLAATAHDPEGPPTPRPVQPVSSIAELEPLPAVPAIPPVPPLPSVEPLPALPEPPIPPTPPARPSP